MAHRLLAAIVLFATAPVHAQSDADATAPPIPSGWSTVPASGAPDGNDGPWWTAFGSPELSALVAQAREQGYALPAAVARIRQAQAAVRIAGAPLWPELAAGTAADRTGLFEGGSASRLEPTLSASYDPDIWGGNRAARRAALAALDAAGHDRDAVELALVSETASAWLATVAAQQRRSIADTNLAIAVRLLSLVEARHRAGAATALDVAQQRGLVAASRQALAAIERDVADNRIALATLLGRAPQGLAVATTTIDGLIVPAVAPGLPSDMLLNRPDIAMAERQLAIADADIAVARAAMLPRLSLTGGASSGGNGLSSLFDNPLYSLAAGLAAPIFSGGRLKGARNQAAARREELVARYRQTIVAAFGEVERALAAIESIDRQAAAQAEAVRQAELAQQLAESRYRAGAETLLTLLDTQRTLYAEQESAVVLRHARLDAAIALFRALGGYRREAATRHRPPAGKES